MGIMMTAAKSAKAAGLKSLAEVSTITGISRQTLENWYRNRPELWKVVLAGCLEIKNGRR